MTEKYLMKICCIFSQSACESANSVQWPASAEGPTAAARDQCAWRPVETALQAQVSTQGLSAHTHTTSGTSGHIELIETLDHAEVISSDRLNFVLVWNWLPLASLCQHTHEIDFIYAKYYNFSLDILNNWCAKLLPVIRYLSNKDA